MPGFVDLIVWREAAALAGRIDGVAKTLRQIGATDAARQILRAAESIPANIAEGYGRGVGKDGLRFFRIAKASADEVENHLRVAGFTKRLPADLIDDLLRHTIRVRYLILQFMKSIERRM